MSRLEHDIERDLRQIADRATPSPDAWASIQQRIADQDPIQETEIIMLMENTTTTRRWPLVAAAAAVLAIVVAGIALIVRDDGEQLPADVPSPPTEVIDRRAGTAAELPPVGSVLEPGRYTTETPGVALTLSLAEGQTAPWTLAADERGGIQLMSDDTAREFIAIGRIGSFYDADEARNESTTGLGSIPPDDIDGWIDANGIIVDESAETTVGGRSAKYRRIRLDTTAGATADFCPVGEQPCLWAISGSADIIDASSQPVPIGRDRLHSIWLVEMDEFEPLVVIAIPNLTDEETWFEATVQPIVDSIELGEPAPAVPGGTARSGTPLPDVLGALDAPAYSVDSLGVPLTFAAPPLDDVDPWRVQVADDIAVTVGPNGGFVSMNRVGSFYAAAEAQDPGMVGLGSVPADDIDGWILRNGIVVDDRDETTVGGYPAEFRQVRAPAGAGDATALCPVEMRPCVSMSSASADLQSTYDAVATGVFGEHPHYVWIVELGEFEPLLIWSNSATGDDDWLDEVTPFVESITIGEPAPAVDGGTARLPERITVTGDMTVTQTGERNLDEPWPIERTGPIVGDINGTHSGTGISSPNGAEVTLDWTMDVTIDGLGSGTLTLRSDEVWTGDAARTAVDVVLGGTGDFEGVTGYGSTVHTDDGSTFTTQIELHLTRPAG